MTGRDATLSIMLGLRDADRRVAVVNLSRNFGKEIALTAGLDHAAAADAVVVIDADLQDPPEVIPDLVAAWRAGGVDIAYAQRRVREGETWMKKATASAFYRVMQRIGGKVQLPPNTGDFRLMSRRSLDALLSGESPLHEGALRLGRLSSVGCCITRAGRPGEKSGNTGSWDSCWRVYSFNVGR